MLNILKSFISSKTNKNNKANLTDAIESYFFAELQKTDLIKPEKHHIVLQHLTHKINLNKSNNKLSSEEKKSLGVNPRLSITHDLINVLNTSGLNEADPKMILTYIFYRATFAKSHNEQLKQYRESGIKEFKILSANDEQECSWCDSMNNKIYSVNTDINKLISENCTCVSHCRICTKAVI